MFYYKTKNDTTICKVYYTYNTYMEENNNMDKQMYIV